MHTQRLVVRLGVAALLIGLASCTETGESGGPKEARGIQPLAAPIPEQSVYLFDSHDFGGNVTRLDNVTGDPAGAPADITAKGQSSARWNLPPGAVVILYSDVGAKGNEVALWGKGQMPSLNLAHMDNNVKQWAWYPIGGTSAPGMTAAGNTTARPPGATPTTSLPYGTIELYREHDFGGQLTTIGPVNNVEVGTLQGVGAATDRMSSLRWNLPPGTMTILYEKPDGTGRQVVLWGSGQYTSAAPMGFNDHISSWASYDVTGAGPAQGAGATTQPSQEPSSMH